MGRRQLWLPLRTDNTFGLGVPTRRLILAVWPHNIVTDSPAVGFVLLLRTGQMRRELQRNNIKKRLLRHISHGEYEFELSSREHIPFL